MIRDDDEVSLIVLYGESPSLIRRLRENGPSRSLFRTLQQYAVNISKKEMDELFKSGCVEPLHGLWVQCQDGVYMKGRGLRIKADGGCCYA